MPLGGDRTDLASRLANYLRIDRDDYMRQAFDRTEELIDDLQRRPAASPARAGRHI